MNSDLPSPAIRRVAIVGAGAIGIWIGARLAQAGCQLSALARGATLSALRSDGLRLQSGTKPLIQAAVQASDRAVDLGEQDLVVIALKAPTLAEVAQQIGPLIGPHTLVLTAMNGVPWWFFEGFGGELAGTRLQSIDPEGRIAAALPSAQVLGAVVHASCAVSEPGLVQHHFGQGLVIGEPAGGLSPRVQALAQLLGRAGFETETSGCIQRAIWFKLWGNMTVNPISAFTGATVDRIVGDPLVRGFMSQVMIEAAEIGARIGLPITMSPDDRHQVTRKIGAFRSSMLQDVDGGRAIELDTLVGAVREIGEAVGVPTPCTDALMGLTRVFARERGLYPRDRSEGAS